MARFDFQKGDLVQNLFFMNTKKAGKLRP